MFASRGGGVQGGTAQVWVMIRSFETFELMGPNKKVQGIHKVGPVESVISGVNKALEVG